MGRIVRFLSWVAVVLLSLVIVGGLVYRALALPKTDGTSTVAGLTAPVDVVRDAEGIPHIYAASDDDAWFALGYAHAQDRLWQMEMNRRIAAGRTAEILGPGGLEIDRFLRTMGIGRNATLVAAALDPATQNALARYASGVNANLAERRRRPRVLLPPEFVLTGAPFPDDWTPADSVGWTTMMAWDLSGNWNSELLRMRLAERLSVQQIGELLPPYPGDAPLPVADYAALYRGLAPATPSPAAGRSGSRLSQEDGHGARFARPLPSPPPEGEGAVGSNNWVVSGARTASGKPLLANDPHLSMSAPSIWYMAHVSAPGLDVIGSTLPGIPFVVIGRNQRIGWGLTNTGPDTQDLYLEELRERDGVTEVRTPDGWQAVESRTETIRVKGEADVTLVVRNTRHGPLVSDVARSAQDALRPYEAGRYALAFRWAALRPDDRTVQAGFAVNRARDWTTFLAALRDFHAPQQNFVYADVDGNIGFVAPGRIPVRKPEHDLMGLTPAPGWDARYDWDGFIAFDELPRQLNPPGGRIATANDKVVPPGYRPFITSEWAPPFRVRRIEALLDAGVRHDVASFAAIQGDLKSLAAATLLPLLLATRLEPVASGADLTPVLTQLAAWDGTMRAGAPEPLIFAAWMRELSRSIPRDEIGPALFPAAWEQRTVFLIDVLSDRDGRSRWCDDVETPAVETCDQMKTRALDVALTDLTRRLGSDRSRWRWDALHFSRSEHRPFSRVPPLDRLFNLTVPVGGDSNTVNVAGYAIRNVADPFVAHHGPSLRQIIDFGDLEASRFIASTGQSGNRLSPFYASFVDRWSRVESVPMQTHRDSVERGAIGTLRLTPALR